jgi:hypothetical protein
VSAGIELKWIVAGAGAAVMLVALIFGAWSKKLGLYTHVSDDLAGEELVTGIGDDTLSPPSPPAP